VLLAGIQNDPDGDAPLVGFDHGVGDCPVSQRIGRHVDLRPGRPKQLHVHVLEVLDRCVMDFDGLGARRPRDG
jgi:hypothetical protein